MSTGPLSPSNQALSVDTLPLSQVAFPFAPPSAARRRATGAQFLPLRPLNMATFRFTLLFSLLLGVALLAAPRQAAANIGWQCSEDLDMCLDHRLRCPECAVNCKKVALEEARWGNHLLSRVAKNWAIMCDKRIPNKLRSHGGVWRRAR